MLTPRSAACPLHRLVIKDYGVSLHLPVFRAGARRWLGISLPSREESKKMIDEYTGKKIISPLDFSQLLFEVKTKDGHEYRIYLDGSISGFPDSSLVVNHAFPLFSKLISIARSISGEECSPTVSVSDN